MTSTTTTLARLRITSASLQTNDIPYYPDHPPADVPLFIDGTLADGTTWQVLRPTMGARRLLADALIDRMEETLDGRRPASAKVQATEDEIHVALRGPLCSNEHIIIPAPEDMNAALSRLAMPLPKFLVFTRISRYGAYYDDHVWATTLQAYIDHQIESEIAIDNPAEPYEIVTAEPNEAEFVFHVAQRRAPEIAALGILLGNADTDGERARKRSVPFAAFRTRFLSERLRSGETKAAASVHDDIPF